MPNYRRSTHSSGYSSNPRAKGVTTLVITALLVVGIFLGIKVLSRSSSSDESNTTNSDEIQTLESVLNGVNLPLNTQNVNGTETESTKQACTGTISSISTQDKIVALTFDSLSITDYADQMLTTLKNENVPAFFFVTGDFATAHADIMQKISADGFGIGNHGDTHADFTTLEASDVITQITNATTKIETAIGKAPTHFMRPPYNKESTSISQTIRDQGYCPILWSIDSIDWKEASNSEDVVNAVTGHLQPGGIIWMNFGHQTASDALPQIIQKVREAGYAFVDLRDYIAIPEKK
ncbi:MAG: polysaccharide deacetylase family protein [Patescibacteria group bacterium]|jgi:peptidoglycan/xylan/chitin deacetylase (PgdA/CDA1 family)